MVVQLRQAADFFTVSATPKENSIRMEARINFIVNAVNLDIKIYLCCHLLQHGERKRSIERVILKLNSDVQTCQVERGFSGLLLA